MSPAPRERCVCTFHYTRRCWSPCPSRRNRFRRRDQIRDRVCVSAYTRRVAAGRGKTKDKQRLRRARIANAITRSRFLSAEKNAASAIAVAPAPASGRARARFACLFRNERERHDVERWVGGSSLFSTNIQRFYFAEYST